MKPILILTVFAVLSVPALAQMADHSTMDHSGHAVTGTEIASSLAFAEANAKMHGDMAIEFTGNADVDFIRGMIPHHQGAVEMARIVLEHGKDPEVRKLAETIIAAQEAELVWMKGWLDQQAQ